MGAAMHGVCETCRKQVPASRVIRDGNVYISKACPVCGTTEALVSTDAATWQRKRELWRYDPDKARACTLNCRVCGHEHFPRMVFLDLTNRCNMNCPICIANIPGMGFEFHPPLLYFERVLKGLGEMNPKPTVQLFGGEPTVRDDMFEIAEIARRYGLKVRVVTNGLQLPDEEYCKKLCDAKASALVGFDGRDPAIYARLRKSPGAYEKKLKAIENLKKYSKTKSTIMCCVARHINDKHMRDLIDFCHENRDCIGHLHLIPLTETWEEGEFETDVATTIEDVERIIGEAFPGEKVEFLPAGLGHYLRAAASFFGEFRLTFGGVHPNCESATVLLSDGECYRPVGYFMKRPLTEFADEVVERAIGVNERLARLDPARFLQRWRGRFIVMRTFVGPLYRTLDFTKILKGNRFLAALRILGGALVGKGLKSQLRKHTNVAGSLGMIILPFEEYHSIDGHRLQNCAAGFAFEDPETKEIMVVPVCGYSRCTDEVERKIAQKYQSVPAVAAAVSAPERPSRKR